MSAPICFCSLKRPSAISQLFLWLFVGVLSGCASAGNLYASICVATPAEHVKAICVYLCMFLLFRGIRPIPQGVSCTETLWEQRVTGEGGKVGTLTST